jgi:hypothetical protein
MTAEIRTSPSIAPSALPSATMRCAPMRDDTLRGVRP